MSKSFHFSLLNNDVDLDDRVKANKNTTNSAKEKEVKQSSTPVKKPPPPKPSQKSLKKKQEKESLQALAFGNSKGKKKQTSAGDSVKPNSSTSQGKANKKDNNKNGSTQCNGNAKNLSEDWKTRDEQFVDDQNEMQLREALLQSKLEYEANKKIQDLAKEEQAKAKKKKKEKGGITMSLSEFNSFNSNEVARKNGLDAKAKAAANHLSDENFFQDVDQLVRNTLLKESRIRQYNEQQLEKEKACKNGRRPQSPALPKMVPIAEVEKRDFEIQALRLEVESLREQLQKVKARNKKLNEIVATSEMREFRDILNELNKVTTSRDEFSAEVASLSEQLEQEKTKVSLLQEKSRKK